MTKILWLSDLHYRDLGDVQGHDPRIRLEAAIAHINEHHKDAAFVVITGDMADNEQSYSALAKQLDTFSIPVLPLTGNHDSRDALRKSRPLPNNCMDDFVQYFVELPSFAVICLDTKKEGSDCGEFCAARRAWLCETLADLGDKPAYLFMHHPPMTLGLPMQDLLMMKSGDQFLDMIGWYKNVKHLFLGHVHRPTAGTIGGLPYATIGAVSYQAPAPNPRWDWDSFSPAKEAPQYGVIDIWNGHVTLQYTQFCTYETGVHS